MAVERARVLLQHIVALTIGGVMRVPADRISVARILLAIAAAAAAIAAISDISTVINADQQHTVVEMWRGYGLVMFAAAFALLAVAPLAFRGLWELVIFHKVALTITAIFLSGTPGTGSIIGWDGGLAVVLIASYVLVRGWRLWSVPRQPAPHPEVAAAH